MGIIRPAALCEHGPAPSSLEAFVTHAQLTVSQKVALLFEYGESRGLDVAYRAIAQATGENGNNIRKIYLGDNANPGLRTLTALVNYFGVDLAFFNCATQADCQAYLARIGSARATDALSLRLEGVSEKGLELLRDVADVVRRSESLPPL